MKKSLLIVFLISSLVVSGQKRPAKFGDIPMEDMTMKAYPLDSSAAAVVLFDFGVSYVTSQPQGSRIVYSWNFERHTRIKILKKEGLQQGTNVSILLQGNQILREL